MKDKVPATSMLLVAIDFPPARTSGVYRPVYLCKHLAERGGDITVVSVADHMSPRQDPSLTAKLGDAVKTIYRRGPMFKKFTSGIYRKYERSSAGDAGPSGSTRMKISLLRLMKKYLLSPVYTLVDNFVFFPDVYIHWALKNLFYVRRLIKRRHIANLVTTSPPRTAALIGWLLKRSTGVRWIVDFRDLWIDQEPPSRPLNTALHNWCEKLVCRNADAIIVVSPHNRERFLSRHPYAATKTYIVTNGYDDDDFSDYTPLPPRPKDAARMVFLGSLYQDSADSLLQAVHDLFAESPDLAGRFSVDFIGHPYPGFNDRVSDLGLQENIRTLDLIPHDEVVPTLSRYDILLLLTGIHEKFSPGTVSGKVFEYMALRIPILHIGQEGDARQLLRKANIDYFAEATDTARIKEKLRLLIHAALNGDPLQPPDREFIRRFGWRNLAGMLQKILAGARPEDIEYV